MTTRKLRQLFFDFFRSKGHTIIPSASLVPENDPTTLFTGSGMQPLALYLLGQPHPEGKRVTNSQKCFRAEDIDEVGDNRHTTFFEMLGNWSFGDYFKQEQLPWLFEFLTDKEKGAGLDPKNLYVTVFAGDKETGIPRDEESVEIWKKLFAEKGIEANYVELGSEKEGSKKGMQGGRIFSYDVEKNWWSRAGVPAKMPAGEPGGPDSEVFYDFGTPHDARFGKECHPNCDCGRFLEIGNSVFMEYKKREDGTFEKLAQRNVDFGGGLERITTAVNNDPDIFNIDVFENARKVLEGETNKLYTENGTAFRIILDHMRAAVFLITDGISPSNIGRGYLVRRLLRRAIRFGDSLGIIQGSVSNQNTLSSIAKAFIEKYIVVYPQLSEHANHTLGEIEKEERKFRETLKNGLKELQKMAMGLWESSINGRVSETAGLEINGKNLFFLYSTYGFPFELSIEEINKIREVLKRSGDDLGLLSDTEIQKLKKEFNENLERHQELSQTASAGTFKGGLADYSKKTVRLHTAHHLLLKALQLALKAPVKQRGSNITSERLRIDFSYDAKLTEEQKREVERIVNEKVKEDLPVVRREMSREDAEKVGAEHEFGQKYPDRVSVYSIGPSGATLEDPQFKRAFSIEFCGGPHVARTGEIGHFRILKEEASAAGVRRIRAVIE